MKIQIPMAAVFPALCLWVFLEVAAFASGVGFDDEIRKLGHKIHSVESVAVSHVYEEHSGDVTALGNRWRDRIEACLIKTGIKVKTRKDLGILMDELESFGIGKGQKGILDRAGAQVLVCGTYAVQYEGVGNSRKPMITVRVKALRLANAGLIMSFAHKESLGPGWERLASQKTGNVFHEGLETIVPGPDDRPRIKARLDRNPPCYSPGVSATISVETDPGGHLYILNVAADHTVTLLYPNSRMKDRPLPSGKFLFPPKALGNDVLLAFFPLRENEMCQEAIKVIASRVPLDFSFLPVPEDRIYAGVNGGDMKKVLDVLRQAKGWNEMTLSYWVGLGCE